MPPLKLGIVDQSPVPNGSDARAAVASTLELARLADRLGYSRYWLAEHHSTNSFAGSAPEVLIPRVASVTERIRVGSGGVMLPHYSPYKVAEQFRMLQTLFPGRIDLGLGRAPAGTGRAAQALRYGRPGIPIEHFPQQLDDLAGWLGESFDEGHPMAKVRATPRAGVRTCPSSGCSRRAARRWRSPPDAASATLSRSSSAGWTGAGPCELTSSDSGPAPIARNRPRVWASACSAPRRRKRPSGSP